MLPISRKKALNKSTLFEINPKSVSTSCDQGFVEKYNFSGPKDCFYLNQCLNKLKKTVPTSRKFFFKYWSPSKGNNAIKENMNKRISFPENRKSVATGRNKGFL